MDELFEQFYGTGPGRPRGYSFHRQRPSFTVNGMDPNDLFSWMFQGEELKSVYVQKVRVPLKDLYSGKNGFDLTLHDNVWKRYRAAFRGKAALPSLYQACAVVFSSFRFLRPPIALTVGCLLFHLGLPRPSVLDFTVDIQSGWKGGTKLRFQDNEPGFESVFVLIEEKDEYYTRRGNDLVTTIPMSRIEATKRGLEGYLRPLGNDDDLIPIRIRPGQIHKSGDEIVVKGRGWRKRKSGKRGNVIVVVKIVSSTKKAKAGRKGRFTRIRQYDRWS